MKYVIHVSLDITTSCSNNGCWSLCFYDRSITKNTSSKRNR